MLIILFVSMVAGPLASGYLCFNPQKHYFSLYCHLQHKSLYLYHLMLQSLLPGGQKTNLSEVWSKKSIHVFVNCCFTGSTSASHSFNNGLFSVLVQTLLLKHTIGQQDQIFRSRLGFD